ncbi:MAG: FkbM family methyltransferase [Alphaproteobacteria bacterium]|nr:FkbM family methyltransferase [Alphaproteobacteria bacterium]
MFALISRLRHGSLRALGWVWRPLGSVYRFGQNVLGWPRSVAKQIGPYGPFRLNGRFAFSNYADWGGKHNSGFRRCIDACLPGSVVFDVGAHVGIVTLCASAAIGPDGRLFAFEPAEGNLRYLRNHKALNDLKNVEVVDSLVGASPLDAVEFLESAGDSGLNTRAPRHFERKFVKRRRRQLTLDGFCDERGVLPSVVKIDVEGAEVDVLRGATKMIAASRPLIILSVHPRQIALLGGTAEDLYQLVRGMGYEVALPDGQAVSVLSSGEYVLTPREAR